MKSARLFALLLLYSALVLTGCAKYEYLQSEKKVKGLLKGSWELVRIPLKDENGNELPRQRWIFTEDRIYRQRMDNGVFVDIENATYTVDTKLMKVLFLYARFRSGERTGCGLDGGAIGCELPHYRYGLLRHQRCL